MKKIIVAFGVRRQIKEEGFGCYPVIQKALNYELNTKQAQRIRGRALVLGGVIMTQDDPKKK